MKTMKTNEEYHFPSHLYLKRCSRLEVNCHFRWKEHSECQSWNHWDRIDFPANTFPGGSNTAGLGGFGGPYRLDAGHDVTQVPQSQKDSVPEDVRRAAREMGQKAFKERYG